MRLNNLLLAFVRFFGVTQKSRRSFAKSIYCLWLSEAPRVLEPQRHTAVCLGHTKPREKYIFLKVNFIKKCINKSIILY